MGAGVARFTTQVDSPLPRKSKLTLGYGDGGVEPWQFTIPDGETKDVGCFKLFLTTRPASFESLIQDSPFEEPDEDKMFRKGEITDPPKGLTWGTQLVTILQKST